MNIPEHDFNIFITDNSGRQMKFDPAEDITAHETMLIAQGLLVSLSAMIMRTPKDLWWYMQFHKLDRHFVPVIAGTEDRDGPAIIID